MDALHIAIPIHQTTCSHSQVLPGPSKTRFLFLTQFREGENHTSGNDLNQLMISSGHPQASSRSRALCCAPSVSSSPNIPQRLLQSPQAPQAGAPILLLGRQPRDTPFLLHLPAVPRRVALGKAEQREESSRELAFSICC